MVMKRNGEFLDVMELPRASGGGGGGGGGAGLPKKGLLSFNPPKFGKGADYVIIGPEWRDGDTCEFIFYYYFNFFFFAVFSHFLLSFFSNFLFLYHTTQQQWKWRCRCELPLKT